MPFSFRSALLIGSSLAFFQVSAIAGDDPLLPEGAQTPTRVKELILPPILNEAPPGSAIELPPPGQEALLGRHPAGAAKAEARIVKDEVAGDTVVADTAQADQPVVKKIGKKGKKRAQAAVADASEAKSEQVAQSGIVQTNSRLGSSAFTGAGGPELSGPPTLQDSVTPIRNGDTLTAKQAQAVVPADRSGGSATNSPAIERFQLAQATTSPMQVAPKVNDRAAPNGEEHTMAPAKAWRFKVTGGVGYGSVDVPEQTYLTTISAAQAQSQGVNICACGGVGGLAIAQGLTPTGIVRSKSRDDLISYEAAIAANLTGDMEPLIDRDGRPFVEVRVSGYNADFKTSPGTLGSSDKDNILFITGPQATTNSKGISAGDFTLQGGVASNTRYDGKQDVVRVEAHYGESWDVRDNLEVTAKAGVAYTRRDIQHQFSFDANGREPFQLSASNYKGVYDTELNSDTVSFILGFGASLPLEKSHRVKLDLGVRGSYDITQADGTDRLTLNRFGGSAYTKTQVAALNRTRESFGYGATAGVSYAVTDTFGLRAGVDFQSTEGVPRVVRNGAEPSRIELDREDVVIGSLTASVKF